jgi:TolA-binding protein
VYPDPKVTDFINKNLNPVRLHVKNHAQEMERFGVMWTPTVLVIDPEGNERYRIEGFLPTSDFLAQLHLGLAQASFKTGQYGEAEKRFRRIVDEFPENDAAAEAQYWAGVSRYKGTNDASALGATAAAFKQKYADTPWAKKASIWG